MEDNMSLQHSGKLHKYMSMMKLIIVLSVSALFMTLVLICCLNAQENSPLDSAMRILAEEKSLAESYSSILNEFGKENPKSYAEGIALYAKAKAKFDGFIEQLKFNLMENDFVNQSADFNAELAQAAEQRFAFTDFVDKAIIGDDPGRKNPLAKEAIATLPELIQSLTNLGHTIWKEYRSTKKERQQEILNQLDSMKWRNFSEIAGSA
jgi:hypothetical protein